MFRATDVEGLPTRVISLPCGRVSCSSTHSRLSDDGVPVTGGGRRRRFTTIEKATIVEESYTDGNSVCCVARRHGLTPQQLFGWRRLARLGSCRSAERPLFVPVVVTPEPEAPRSDELSACPKPRKRRRQSERAEAVFSSAPPATSAPCSPPASADAMFRTSGSAPPRPRIVMDRKGRGVRVEVRRAREAGQPEMPV